MNDIAESEVDWYRINGRFPSRIKKDAKGNLYVIGDASWNLHRPLHERENFEPAYEKYKYSPQKLYLRSKK